MRKNVYGRVDIFLIKEVESALYDCEMYMSIIIAMIVTGLLSMN